MKDKKIFWRTNQEIKASELRVIDEDGTQIGVLARQKALDLAQEKGVDLVEIAPKANPPVAKIIDFGKFRYREEKKLRAQKKRSKSGEVKEIRFSPFIAQNDYETRIKRLKEFLGDGYKIRLVVVFKGRHMGSKQFGYDLLKKVVSETGNQIAVDMEPKFLGRHLVMIVSPVRKANYGKNENPPKTSI